jgi:hypothetical protein
MIDYMGQARRLHGALWLLGRDAENYSTIKREITMIPSDEYSLGVLNTYVGEYSNRFAFGAENNCHWPALHLANSEAEIVVCCRDLDHISVQFLTSSLEPYTAAIELVTLSGITQRYEPITREGSLLVVRFPLVDPDGVEWCRTLMAILFTALPNLKHDPNTKTRYLAREDIDGPATGP